MRSLMIEITNDSVPNTYMIKERYLVLRSHLRLGIFLVHTTLGQKLIIDYRYRYMCIILVIR